MFKSCCKYVLLLKLCALFFLPFHISIAIYPNNSLVNVAFSTSACTLSLKVAVSFFPSFFPANITFSIPKNILPTFLSLITLNSRSPSLPVVQFLISHSFSQMFQTLLLAHLPHLQPFPCMPGTVPLLSSPFVLVFILLISTGMEPWTVALQSFLHHWCHAG